MAKTNKHNKYTYESVKNFIEVESNSKCKLLSLEYINCKDKLNIQCKCGDYFLTTFDKFKWQNKRQCDECTNDCLRKRYTKTHEKFIEEVYDLVGDEYIVVDKYTNSSTPIKLIHNKYNCMYEWNVRPNDFISKENRCPKCQHRSYKKTTEEYKQEIYNIVGDEFNILGEYITSYIPIQIQHICGYIWEPTPHTFLCSYHKCPKCNGNLKKTHEEFVEEVYNLVKEEYSVVGKYINADTKVELKHNICGNTFNILSHNFSAGQRCPICSKSRGENVIKTFLDLNNIKYKQNYRFNDCKYKNTLPFDFAIFDNQNNLFCLIEYDGAQHYYAVRRFGGIETYELQQKRDKIKTEYAKSNNIKLIRIPYWNFKKIDSILEKELLDILQKEVL